MCICSYYLLCMITLFLVVGAGLALSQVLYKGHQVVVEIEENINDSVGNGNMLDELKENAVYLLMGFVLAQIFDTFKGRKRYKY